MSMSKQDFIALADRIIRSNNERFCEPFTHNQIETLASFCASRNPRFNRDRWLSYIAGTCGPNGGRVKHSA